MKLKSKYLFSLSACSKCMDFIPHSVDLMFARSCLFSKAVLLPFLFFSLHVSEFKASSRLSSGLWQHLTPVRVPVACTVLTLSCSKKEKINKIHHAQRSLLMILEITRLTCFLYRRPEWNKSHTSE